MKQLFNWLTLVIIVLVSLTSHLFAYSQDNTFIVRSVAWSSDGNYIAFAPGLRNCDIDQVDNYNVQIIEKTSGEPVKQLRFHSCAVQALSWNADGSKIITTGGRSEDSKAIVWDVLNERPVGVSQPFSMPGRIKDVLSPNDLWVANISEAVAEINIWDIETGDILFTLPANPEFIEPYTIAWDSSGSFIVAGYSSGNIAIWDVQTKQVVYSFVPETDSAIVSIAWSDDDTMIASGSFDGSIKVWDVETKTLRHTFSLHTQLVPSLDFAPDNIRLASASFDGTVKVWNTLTGELIETFTNPSGGRVYALDWSPDGTQLAYGGAGNSEIVLEEPLAILTPTPVPPTLTPTPMPPTAVPTTAVPPTAIPTTAVPTTPAPTAVPTPVVGPGWIAFSSNRDGVGQRSLYAARPDDTSAVRLTSDAGVIDRWPAWSPDRTLIAFTRTDSAGNEDIYIKRVTDNSAPVALGSLVNSTKSNGTPSNERQPVWSPNGTQLAYVSDRDGDKEIYVVNIGADLAVSSRTKLTDNAAEDTSPDWYGNYIAFTSDSDGNFELYTMPATGGSSIKLTNTGSVNGNVVKHSSPKWSPDGKYLAYTTNWQDGGDLDIYAFPMGSNGDKSGNRIPITTARSENDEFVAWEPQHTTSYRFAFVTDSGLGENFNDVYLMTVSEQSSGTSLITTVSPAPVGWNSATTGENTPDW